MMERSFLERAIDLALRNVEEKTGGPFGAVIVKDGLVVGEGQNRVTTANDPTAHAEVVAIRAACKKLGTFDLSGAEIYSSCEPCPMCFSAICWANISRITFAARKEDAARAGFRDAYIYEQIAAPFESRLIKHELVNAPRALDPFKAWIESPESVRY